MLKIFCIAMKVVVRVIQHNEMSQFAICLRKLVEYPIVPSSVLRSCNTIAVGICQNMVHYVSI